MGGVWVRAGEREGRQGGSIGLWSVWSRNYAVFYFAGKSFFFNIYEVFTSPEKEKRSTYYYWGKKANPIACTSYNLSLSRFITCFNKLLTWFGRCFRTNTLMKESWRNGPGVQFPGEPQRHSQNKSSPHTALWKHVLCVYSDRYTPPVKLPVQS